MIYGKPCMYIQDERLVGRSAHIHTWSLNRHILTPMDIIYDKACEYNQDER